MKSSSATIFLADQRDVVEQENATVFKPYAERLPAWLEKLSLFEDIILTGAGSYTVEVSWAGWLMLLPVAGAVRLAGHDLVVAGQVFWLPVQKGQAVHIRNPFSEGNINVVLAGFAEQKGPEPLLLTFPINDQPGQLLPVSPGLSGASIFIGKFQGREEEKLDLLQEKGLFVTVLAGVFEVAGRLLHERDALAVWDCEAIDLEALSNEALVLCVKMR